MKENNNMKCDPCEQDFKKKVNELVKEGKAPTHTERQQKEHEVKGAFGHTAGHPMEEHHMGKPGMDSHMGKTAMGGHEGKTAMDGRMSKPEKGKEHAMAGMPKMKK